jgi:hypothetical protein
LAQPIAEFMTKESERIGAKESLSEVMGMMQRAGPALPRPRRYNV